MMMCNTGEDENREESIRFGDVDFEGPVGHLGGGLRLIAEDKGWDYEITH